MSVSDLPFDSRDVVESWERRAKVRATFMAEASARMLAAARIGPGNRVLDIGTGTGDTALMAAESAGASGKVVAIDASSAMIEQAVRKAREAGMTQVDLRVMDGTHLELNDASFDAIIGRNSMQFLPGWPLPLNGFHRVLAPGGRLAFVVWATSRENPFFYLPVSIALQHGWLRAPPSAMEGPFRLADAARLLADLKDAGFRDAAVERVEAGVRMPDGAALAVYLRESPMYHANADHLTETERAAFDGALDSTIEQFRDGDVYRIPVVSLLASATV